MIGFFVVVHFSWGRLQRSKRFDGNIRDWLAKMWFYSFYAMYGGFNGYERQSGIDMNPMAMNDRSSDPISIECHIDKWLFQHTDKSKPKKTIEKYDNGKSQRKKWEKDTKSFIAILQGLIRNARSNIHRTGDFLLLLLLLSQTLSQIPCLFATQFKVRINGNDTIS